MNKATIALTMVLVSLTAIAQSATKENGWYIGSKIGWSKYHDISFNDDINNNIDFKIIPNNQLGMGAFIGYQINSHLGSEFGYDWFGHISHGNEMSHVDLKSHGVSLTAKLSYPLVNNLEVYTRLGGVMWYADFHGSYKEREKPESNYHIHDAVISPVVSVGLEYSLTKAVATRIDYQWIDNVVDTSSISCPNSSFLGIGISYKFNKNNNFNETTETRSNFVPSINQSKPLSIRSNVFFSFDKSTLDIDGTEKLDELFSKVKGSDLENISVIVLGYTDRIGSDVYNQKLSHERIKNVINYLISKGIPADRISSYNMGKSKSLTGEACNKISSRSDIIDCLSPDRRVEIEIKGIKGT